MPSWIQSLSRTLRPWHAGIVAMVVGAVLLTLGLIQTTVSTKPLGCPSGSELLAKFEFQGGAYVFEKGTPGAVTITNGTATGGSWTSTLPVSAVIVKGGDDSVITTLSPSQTSGEFSNEGLPPVGAGNIPDISNVQFCTPTVPPTTTTAPPITTTTAPPVTTTAGPTTTTAAPTTTTAAPTTTTAGPTTTTAAPTTTAPPTTTTAPPTTTTAGSTTTTVAGSTTTTAPTTTTVEVSPATVVVLGSRTELPRTGDPSIPLVVIGSVLLAGGLALTVISRFRDRRTRA